MANSKYADLTEEERRMLEEMHQGSSLYGPTQMPGGPQGINPSLKDPQIKNFSKKRQNRPNILDIAPAEQDKTRVGGLMEDIEVPAGEFADMDILEEKLLEMGFPPGLVEDMINQYKTKPDVREWFNAKVEQTNSVFQGYPQVKKDLFKGTDLENIDEDLPDEPFGPGGWGAGGL